MHHTLDTDDVAMGRFFNIAVRDTLGALATLKAEEASIHAPTAR